MKEMTKEYILRTLKEEKLWKEKESDTFTFGKWTLTLAKEEMKYHPFTFSVRGKHENGSRWSRRYTSMEKAFLHIVNRFNENVAIQDCYENLDAFICA